MSFIPSLINKAHLLYIRAKNSFDKNLGGDVSPMEKLKQDKRRNSLSVVELRAKQKQLYRKMCSCEDSKNSIDNGITDILLDIESGKTDKTIGESKVATLLNKKYLLKQEINQLKKNILDIDAYLCEVDSYLSEMEQKVDDVETETLGLNSKLKGVKVVNNMSDSSSETSVNHDLDDLRDRFDIEEAEVEMRAASAVTSSRGAEKNRRKDFIESELNRIKSSLS